LNNPYWIRSGHY